MTVADVPLVLPVTSPVISPTNAVDVIDVAPVTMPASTLIVPSRTIALPLTGVILIAPELLVISFPLMVRLSTVTVVSVPRDVIAG